MTVNEAKIFLSLSDEDVLDDVYEQKLFEWRNFFVNRFPIPSLFRSKIEQLEKLEEAYLALGGTSNDLALEISFEKEFSNNFKETFHQFQEQRAHLKSLLFSVVSASEMIPVVQSLNELTLSYAAIWNNENLDTTGVVMSKESDPMDLLEAINDAEKAGVHNISQIDKLPQGHLVLNEAKRLSLLIEKSKK